MVHACRIKDGKVAYSNRLVQTHRLQRELKLGFPVYQRVRPLNHELFVPSDFACRAAVSLRCLSLPMASDGCQMVLDIFQP